MNMVVFLDHLMVRLVCVCIIYALRKNYPSPGFVCSNVGVLRPVALKAHASNARWSIRRLMFCAPT